MLCSPALQVLILQGGQACSLGEGQAGAWGPRGCQTCDTEQALGRTFTQAPWAHGWDSPSSSDSPPPLVQAGVGIGLQGPQREPGPWWAGGGALAPCLPVSNSLEKEFAGAAGESTPDPQPKNRSVLRPPRGQKSKMGRLKGVFLLWPLSLVCGQPLSLCPCFLSVLRIADLVSSLLMKLLIWCQWCFCCMDTCPHSMIRNYNDDDESSRTPTFFAFFARYFC